MLELGEAEYMVRSSAYLKSLDDFRRIPLLTTDAGVTVRLRDVARRCEIVKTDSPGEARERLLLSLRGAISKSDGGASLLAELARRPALTIDQDTVMRSDDPGPCETGDIAVERNQAGDIDSAASVVQSHRRPVASLQSTTEHPHRYPSPQWRPTHARLHLHSNPRT